MLDRNFIKKIEKETEKKLQANYCSNSFCVIDDVLFGFGDAEGCVTFTVRAGYSIVKENDQKDYVQKTLKFSLNTDVVKTVAEYTILFYYAIIDAIEGFPFYEVK